MYFNEKKKTVQSCYTLFFYMLLYYKIENDVPIFSDTCTSLKTRERERERERERGGDMKHCFSCLTDLCAMIAIRG